MTTDKKGNILPRIKRAREYHLYDFAGIRYLDLFQNGGRAILGHRPAGLSLQMKSVLAKGLMAEYPSVYETRVIKTLRRFFKTYNCFRLYSNTERALNAVSLYFKKKISIIPDPLFTESEESGFSLWRPFFTPDGGYPHVIIPLLPFPGSFGPVAVCFKESSIKGIPPSDLISPLLLSGIVKLLSELEQYGSTFSELKWKLFDSPLWNRKGPYLLVKQDKQSYKKLFYSFLDHGLVLPPEFPAAAIVPGEFSPGEIKCLKEYGRGEAEG